MIPRAALNLVALRKPAVNNILRRSICASVFARDSTVNATLPADAQSLGAAAAVCDATGAASRRAKNAQPPSLTKIYAELSKARLSSLVVFTSGAGFLMAGAPASLTALAAATIGTSLAAASAGTFNQVYEIKTDAKMMRTHTRPLPSGKITPTHAALFGSATLCASALTLGFGTNELTTLLGIGNVALYALIYTPLKQHSELNTAVGAIVGAIPPLMGWAAATGGILAYEPILLGLGLFWWQFPHFYSLGWTLRKDYARGGYAMAPCFDATGQRTAWLSLRSSLALSSLPFAAVALGVTGPMFAVEGALLNGYLVRLAYNFYKNPTDGTARAVFRCSLWYLPVLLFFMVFHSVHWKKSTVEDTATAEQADTLAFAYNAKDTKDLLEKGMAKLHDLGRAFCVHEIFVRDKLTEAKASVKSVIRAICGDSADSTGSKDAAAPAIVDDAAAQNVRMQCPVVVAEEVAKAAMPNSVTMQVEAPSAAVASTSAT